MVPLLGIVLGVLPGFLDVRSERPVDLPSNWTYSSATATSVLSAIVRVIDLIVGVTETATA